MNAATRVTAACVVLALLLTACATPQQQAAPTTTSAPSPVEQCANLLTYWLDRHLAGTGNTLDYQSMGLTGDQYTAYRALTAEADTTPRPLPRTWTTTGAREACDRIAATATPWQGGPGWPK